MSIISPPMVIKLVGQEANMGDRRNWVHTKFENIWKVYKL